MSNMLRQFIRRYSSCRIQSMLLMGTLEPELSTDINRSNYKQFLDNDIMLIHKSFFPEFVRTASEPLRDRQFLPVLERFKECSEYHGPNREVYSSFSLMQTYRMLEEPQNMTYDNLKTVSMLAWASETIITCALLEDSILDNQDTRWKKTCWYKLPGVGTSTIADCHLLRAMAFDVLKKYFRNHPHFSSFFNLLIGMISGVNVAQTIDVDIKKAFQNQRNTSLLTTKTLNQTLKQKGYIVPVRNPILMAIDLLNRKDYGHFLEAEHILIKLGFHFQINNDMWDCFGKFDSYGRSNGGDIEEGVLSWVVVKALECADEKQKQLIQEHYGRPDSSSRDVVLEVFRTINVVQRYYEYKDKLIAEITEGCQKLRHPGIQSLIQNFVKLVVDVNDDLYE